LSRLLGLPKPAYEALSRDSHEAASRFAWEDIGRATLETYRERLARSRIR
jgi:hypothetical protein